MYSFKKYKKRSIYTRLVFTQWFRFGLLIGLKNNKNHKEFNFHIYFLGEGNKKHKNIFKKIICRPFCLLDASKAEEYVGDTVLLLYPLSGLFLSIINTFTFGRVANEPIGRHALTNDICIVLMYVCT